MGLAMSDQWLQRYHWTNTRTETDRFLSEDEFIDMLKKFVEGLPVEFDQHGNFEGDGKIWVSFELKEEEDE